MKLIIDLLRRVWQSDRSPSDSHSVRSSPGGDRSSMADFVRILQMHDDERGRSNYSN
jgi:hypothetical protein